MIIITSPFAFLSQLKSELSALQLPVLERIFFEIKPIYTDFVFASDFDAFLFVSPRAVEHFRCHGDFSSIKAFAVGESTKLSLQSIGVQNIFCPSLVSGQEALLQIPELQNIRKQRLLIVSGVHNDGYLQKQLIARGATVQQQKCYESIYQLFELSQMQDILCQYQKRLWVLTTKTSVDSLWAIVRSISSCLDNDCVICTHPNILKRAQQRGFFHSFQCQYDQNDILKTIQTIYTLYCV